MVSADGNAVHRVRQSPPAPLDPISGFESLGTLMELAVAMDRIDRLERMVAERTGIELSELRAIDYTEGVADQERRRRFGLR